MRVDERVLLEIAKLPRCFRLRGFPGEYFRPSTEASYLNDYGGVTIYLDVWREGRWLNHTKGSVAEILRELLNVDGDREFTCDADVTAYLEEKKQGGGGMDWEGRRFS